MAEQALFTYEDAVDHLKDVYDIQGLDVTSKPFRAAKRAVHAAYLELAQLNTWNYFERQGQISTEAAYSTGTVIYTHSGGAHERMLTISDGEWPENAARGHVILDGQRYPVATRESDSIITLNPDANPGADVASTSFHWFRAVYPLPVVFRKMSPLTDVKNGREICYLPPGEVIGALIGNYYPSEPIRYTIRNDGDFYGGLSVELLPPPLTARTYDFAGEYEARALTTYRYATGTVSITAGATTVTGSGTTFAAVHVGDIIRFGTANLEPSGIFGSPNTSIGDNPYSAQRTALSVASATSMEVDPTVPSTLSGVKFTISSPLDIHTGGMVNLFYRLCEKYFMRLNPKVLGDHVINERMEKDREVQQALVSAMTSDNRHRENGRITRLHWTDLARPGDLNTGTAI